MYDDKCDDKLMDELVSKSVETMKFVFGGIDDKKQKYCINTCVI